MNSTAAYGGLRRRLGGLVRLSRLLAFECTLNHCTFISFHSFHFCGLLLTFRGLLWSFVDFCGLLGSLGVFTRTAGSLLRGLQAHTVLPPGEWI